MDHFAGFSGTIISLSSHEITQQCYRAEDLLSQTVFAYLQTLSRVHLKQQQPNPRINLCDS